MSERILRSIYIKMLTDDEASESLNAVSEASDKTSKALETTSIEFDELKESIDETVKSFDDVVSDVKDSFNEFGTLEKALSDAGIESTDLGDSFKTTKGALDKLTKEVDISKTALYTMSKTAATTDLTLDKLENSAIAVKNSLNILDNNVDQAKIAFKGLSSSVARSDLATDALSTTLKKTGDSLKKVDSSLDKTKSEFKETIDVVEKVEKQITKLDSSMKRLSAEGLTKMTTKLDSVGTTFQRMATSVMAVSDIYEGFGKLLTQNAELFGLNEEQAAKLNAVLEKNIANFMQVSRVLMGVGDIFEMSAFFITKMIARQSALATSSKVTSASMITDIRAVTLAMMTNPIVILIAAIVAIIIILAIAWKQNWGDIQDVFDRTVGRIFETLNMLGISFKDFGDVLDWLDAAFGRIFWGIMSVWEEVFNELMDIVQEVIVEMIIPVIEELKIVFADIIEPLQAIWAEFGGNKDLLVLVGKIIAYTILAPLILLVSVLKLLKMAWTGNWDPIRKDIELTQKIFKPIFDSVARDIDNIRWLVGVLADAWGNAMSSMKDSIAGLWSWVTGILTHITSMFNLFVALVNAIGDMDWDKVATLASEIVASSAVGQVAKYITNQSALSSISNDNSIGNVYITTASDQPQKVGDEVIYTLGSLRSM